MSMQFQPFDLARIDLRPGHPGAFCVEASAGTGKTYSITGLVLRLVCEQNLPLDEILVVTFTRAAAAELRGRIADRLATAEHDLRHLLVHLRDGADPAGAVARARDAGSLHDSFVAEWFEAANATTERVARWLERVQRARLRVDSATIATIHSFCQRMLEWHAFESDQPLGLDFADDEAQLRAEIVNDLWSELAGTLDDAAWGAASMDPAAFAKAVDGALNAGATPVLHLPIQIPTDWRELLRRVSENTDQLVQESLTLLNALGDVFQEHVRQVTGTAKKDFFDVFELPAKATDKALLLFEPLNDPERREACLRSDFWPKALKALTKDKLSTSLNGQGGAAKTLRAELLASPITEALTQLQTSTLLNGKLGAVLTTAACEEARVRFAQRLQARGELTFDALIDRMADRVDAESRAETAERPLTDAVRGRFRAALIDEFQDTDDRQWKLFGNAFLGSDEHLIFLIGDPKQAIYGFRGADIRTYLDARDAVRDAARVRLERIGALPERGDPGLYTMTRNYRSDGALIVALNRLLGALPAETEPLASLEAPPPDDLLPVGASLDGFFDHDRDTPSGIGYIAVGWQHPSPDRNAHGGALGAPAARLHVPDPAAWTAQPVVFRPACNPRATNEDGESRLGNNEASKAELPAVVAADILRLLRSGAALPRGTDPSGAPILHPVRAGDVAVLVDSWKDGDAIAAALRGLRVPAIVQRGTFVWDSDEAEDLEVLLTALVERPAARTLRPALVGPFLQIPPRALTPDEAGAEQRLERWSETFASWSALWHRHGLLRLISAVLDQRVDPERFEPVAASSIPATGDANHPSLRERALQWADGERRLTNWNHLVELLHAEAAQRFLPPSGQLELLQTRRRGDAKPTSTDDPRNIRLDTDDDAVRVITIHGSKGLEYPIVFAPTLSHKGVVGATPETPLQATLEDETQRTRWFVAHKQVLDSRKGDIESARDRELDEEARRRLYVAVTRAKHQVVVHVRDWTDHKKRSRNQELDPANTKKAHAVAKTALGRALLLLPRVRPAVLAPDADLWFGDVAVALGRVVNHGLGECLFTTENASDPAPEVAHDPAPAADAIAWLPEPTVERERYYDPHYKKSSFSALAKGGGGTHAPLPDLATDLFADENEEEMSLDRGVADEPDDDALPDDPGASHHPAHLPFERSGLAGRDFGTAIHALLETFDFTQAADPQADPAPDDALEASVRTTLRTYGFTLDATAVDGLRADLAAFLRAPLGGPLAHTSLHDIPPALRLDELEFLLPVRQRLDKQRLVDAFLTGGAPAAGTTWSEVPGAWERWIETVERLTPDAFHGFLGGFIDLVFATPSSPRRFHLLDYKTNRLHTRGSTRDDAVRAYEPAGLVEAMLHHRYVLQYHLYLVALHRYLCTRLGQDYDWDAHMGGVWYPFVRGVASAEELAVLGAAPRRGVFHDRPPRERILALDALFLAPEAP